MNAQHIQQYLSKGIRYDGRKLQDFRDIQIEYGVTNTAEGSARVRLGSTEVIAGVKMSVGKPYPDRPDEGALMVGTEFIPLASPDFESGPPGIDSIEVSRVVDRGIRESKCIDTKNLCIEAGEKVWIVSVDVVIINHAGNLMDAAAIAALAALKNATFPAYDKETDSVNYREKGEDKLPLTKEPVSVTVYKLDKYLLFDPLLEEEHAAEARLTVASTADGALCAMQKGGESPLLLEEIKEMVSLAVAKAQEIRKLF